MAAHVNDSANTIPIIATVNVARVLFKQAIIMLCKLNLFLVLSIFKLVVSIFFFFSNLSKFRLHLLLFKVLQNTTSNVASLPLWRPILQLYNRRLDHLLENKADCTKE